MSSRLITGSVVTVGTVGDFFYPRREADFVSSYFSFNSFFKPFSYFTLWRSQQSEQINMENSNTDPNLTESEPSTSEQSTRTINNQTTTSERMERRKYKIPILSDRETDLTNIDPKMWWEQISECIHLTYNRNLEEITDESVRTMDPLTVYHIKGDVIWALGPKAKHEIMRGQWGRELKDVNLPEILTPFKKTFLPVRNVFHS